MKRARRSRRGTIPRAKTPEGLPLAVAMAMAAKRFTLRARVSSDRPAAVRPVLERWFAPGTVRPGAPGELLVEAEVDGEDARELNRSLLSDLRRGEKRTRLRAEWTRDGITERFFDYVPKGRSRV